MESNCVQCNPEALFLIEDFYRIVLSDAPDVFQDSTFLSVSSITAGFGSFAVTKPSLFPEINQNECW